MTTKGKINVRLLRRIQKHILAEPKRFAMGTIETIGAEGARPFPGVLAPDEYNAGNPFEQNQTFPECGTIACILGWSRILGGEQSDAEGMCNAARWPKKLREAYAKAKTPLQRAKIAAARIERYIQTGGAE